VRREGHACCHGCVPWPPLSPTDWPLPAWRTAWLAATASCLAGSLANCLAGCLADCLAGRLGSSPLAGHLSWGETFP